MKIQINENQIDEVYPPLAPNIPGLSFRRFRGEGDYPKMLAVIDGSKDADGIERGDSLEDITHTYTHLVNCNPYQDMLFAEIDGQVIGYNRVAWKQESEGDLVYVLIGFLLPAWRRLGIGSAMLDHAQRRLLEIARTHQKSARKLFESYAADTEHGANALLLAAGFEPVRYFFEMVRRPLTNFPAAEMPEGLEVRPVEPGHVRLIWEAMTEAFQDHWGHVSPEEEAFNEFKDSPLTDLTLWKIAWDRDQIAGMVLNYVNEHENQEYNRRRGYTEDISVRRPWRRKGLARSLLVQSMQMFKDMGMEETALGVDTENLSGALRLYQGVGYREVQRFITYRKVLELANT
jgi:ribosomal protein S18 acetylase RimI-like enzyme